MTAPAFSELKLPDPLTTANGTKVGSAVAWRQQRRPEILELFRTHVYGRMPIGRPESLKFEVTDVTHGMMDGAATRKQVRISYRGPGSAGAIHLLLFVPEKAAKPAPCFLLICNRGLGNIDPTRTKQSSFWPAEQIVARGYAAAVFLNEDVAPDHADEFSTGAYSIFETPGQQRPADAWGSIAAWAWGASRAMDYMETDHDIDSRRVVVIGHSRGGKTALWCGAEDERFAMVVSNESGCGGAALARRKQPTAESIKKINDQFSYWFCENYKKYNDREEELPVDQHMLATLIAPRLLYISSANEDLWADPEGEFLSAVHAGPVYRLLGSQGVESEHWPAPEVPLHGGSIGYHLRKGKHDLTKYDWCEFMDFADRHLKTTVPTRPLL